MDDPLGVGRGKALGDLAGDLGRPLGRERPRPEPLRQVLSLQELGHRVGDSLVRPRIVNRENVRMVQGRDGMRLRVEALEAFAVVDRRVRQHFQRHLAPQPGVPRAVDVSHAAVPERRDDLVRTDLFALGERHLREEYASRRPERGRPVLPSPKEMPG